MSEEKKNGNKISVYVTGFGPFNGHETVNASWEAVRLLPTQLRHNGRQVVIKLLEIPVVYTEVDRYIEDIWGQDPQLVIHCGVNGAARNIHVEKHSFNGKFSRAGWSGACLPCESISLTNNKCEMLSTLLNVDSIVQELNYVNMTLYSPIYQCSTNAGNYLCAYIYLKSLDKDCGRSLFVHVPPIGQPLTSQETSEAILSILEKCLEQLDKQNKL